MKIVLTGGGTGGHFYPVIAVAQELNKIIAEQRLVNVSLYYAADKPYDERLLFENRLQFINIEAGKIRTYSSWRAPIDAVKTVVGVLKSLTTLYRLYPDVVFGKGGYGSFPILFAARILRIPVIIHESDTVPGRVNVWAGKFAEKIGVGFAEATQFFPKEKTAVIGVPIRKELQTPASADSYDYFKIPNDRPVLYVAGGSQGAEHINDVILDILPALLNTVSVVHQTGDIHETSVKNRAQFLLANHPHKNAYFSQGTFNEVALKHVAGIGTLAVSRAGSSLFEYALWGLPAILIPLPIAHGDHQKENATAYARAGGCIVIEEKNLTPNILLSEINRLLADRELLANMKMEAKAFAKPEAGYKIARELIAIGLSHEI